MKKLVVYVSLGLVGCKQSCEIEVDDDTSETEVEEIAKEAMFELIEWGYVPAAEYKGRAGR